MSMPPDPEDGEYEYCKAAEAPEIQQLVAYWNACRGERFAPSRADINPAAIRRILPCLSMIDVIDGGHDFRFRLLGTRIVEGLGRDSTGRYFGDVYGGQPEVMQRMRERMQRVMRLKQPQYTRGKCYWQPDRGYKRFEDVNLPLSSDGRHVDIILGALVLRGAA
jgi:hypothetical protein